MKKEHDYTQDLAHIRSMMERSSKFLSLSGWAGILAGVYALIGVSIAYFGIGFNPNKLNFLSTILSAQSFNLNYLILDGVLVLMASLVTAVFLSYKKASDKGESIWNATSRRLLANMSVPLLTGGLLLILFISKGYIGLILPMTHIFYGFALYNASNFTLVEVKYLGFVQIFLGIISSYFVEYSLIIWALGFGFAHIAYGLYLYVKYEK
jgi:hypothetical protein